MFKFTKFNIFNILLILQVDVLQETVRYIEDLERRLLAQVRTAGLPRQLLPYAKQEQQDLPNTSAGVQSDSAPQQQQPGVQLDRGHTKQPGVGLDQLRSLLHTSLQPALLAKLKKQRREDEDNIARLIRESSGSGAGS